MPRTYSIPASGTAFAVVTESNTGTRGWVFSHVAGDPGSDYEVYETAAGLRWPEGDDPEEAGTGAAQWNSPSRPTGAVDDYLKTRYCLAFHSSTGSTSVHGVRKKTDGNAVVLRALKHASGLL